MTKLISYSLFSAPCETFEKRAYIRGFYFNARMNNLIFPDWRTHLEVSTDIYKEYERMFEWLVNNNNLSLHVNPHPTVVPLCEGMLWRMKPIWKEDISHVLCRDADAITTYKEAVRVQMWLESIYPISSIHDNPAHGGLMGGMVGFETSSFKAQTGFNSFQEMIAGRDLSKRGSDQDLLNNLSLNGVWTLNQDFITRLPQVDERLWESNLVCRHIGSAGVVEMELLRFFKRFDPEPSKYILVEKEYPQLFYWHL